MKIVLAGGGTGGHIYPSMALLPLLRKHFDQIYYIGSSNKKDELIVKKYNLPFYEIDAVKLDRTKLFENFLIPFKLTKCVKKCKSILMDLNPDVVFLKGGFVSLPVAISAHSLKIPCVLHESDLSLGLSNKLSFRYCDKLLTSFESTYLSAKTYYTGTPIREDIDTQTPFLPFNNLKPTILAFGGSQGANEINQYIIPNLEKICKQFNLIHIGGKSINEEKRTESYLPLKFTNEIGKYYHAADLIISRGGANSLFEIMYLKKPSLILPLRKGSRGDQVQNVEYMKKFGVIEVYNDKTDFYSNVISAYKNKEQLVANIKKSPFHDGKEEIVKHIISVI